MQPIFTHTTYSQRADSIKKCILGINTQTPGKVKCFYLRIPRVIELLNQEAKLSPLSMLKSLLSQLLFNGGFLRLKPFFSASSFLGPGELG